MSNEDDLELETVDVVEEVTVGEDEDGNVVIEDTTVYVDEETGAALVDDITIVETPDGLIVTDEVVTALDGDGNEVGSIEDVEVYAEEDDV
ncbi:MAG: hypothetical protein QG597_814 [Actinomycetota bacterium]|nr:hypothetical protein [Actinomycetota bacterium]